MGIKPSSQLCFALAVVEVEVAVTDCPGSFILQVSIRPAELSLTFLESSGLSRSILQEILSP